MPSHAGSLHALGVPRLRAAAALAVSLFTLSQTGALPQSALAHEDPSLPRTSAGAQRASLPRLVGDTGRSAYPLPKDPHVSWRTRLEAQLAELGAGPDLLLAVTVDARLGEFDGRGLERWQVQLPAPAVAPPVVTSAARRAVLLEDGSLLQFDAAGALRRHSTLPVDLRAPDARLLALPDGSLLAAWGDSLSWLDQDGALRSSTRVPSGVVAWQVAAGPAAVLQTSSGAVFTWDGVLEPKRLPVQTTRHVRQWLGPGAPLVSVFEDRIVARDADGRLTTWLQHPRLLAPTAQLAERGEVFARSAPDLLFAVTSAGERARWVLSQSEPGTERPSPLLVDEGGRTATIANDGALVVVSDAVQRLPLPGCSQVLGPVSIAARELALGCADGLLLGVGPRPSSAN